MRPPATAEPPSAATLAGMIGNMELHSTLARRCVAFLFAALLATPTAAQDSSVVEVAVAAMSLERKATVADNMKLTEEESGEFWPIYNEYLGEHEDLTKRLREIILQLAREFETLDDETMNGLLERYHEFRKDRLELRWKTAKELRKKIGGKRAGRLYQIENKLDTIMDMDIVKNVPLVE